jgi:hypothetical protein
VAPPELADPVGGLSGVQRGGGGGVNQAIACREQRIARPAKAHLAANRDLFEDCKADEARAYSPACRINSLD